MSTNGKWRSFPKVPHLLQYTISGSYFGKVKINGKTIRKSLATSVWTTAQLRLNDFLKEHRENRNKVDAPTFKEAAELFKCLDEIAPHACKDWAAKLNKEIACQY